ncbi:DgyrCDS9538 [Dimorphilus gyrociliatus]|uniref:DgyrCDS9538 n=1 Tax=Dimorphilus gyrociliatus TaxID=2664684 RepID=A0A7I8VZZ8_9ANNE|nr:DgyrCDS9538 [Dimorphilus gyrociliatus]
MPICHMENWKIPLKKRSYCVVDVKEENLTCNNDTKVQKIVYPEGTKSELEKPDIVSIPEEKPNTRTTRPFDPDAITISVKDPRRVVEISFSSRIYFSHLQSSSLNDNKTSSGPSNPKKYNDAVITETELPPETRRLRRKPEVQLLQQSKAREANKTKEDASSVSLPKAPQGTKKKTKPARKANLREVDNSDVPYNLYDMNKTILERLGLPIKNYKELVATSSYLTDESIAEDLENYLQALGGENSIDVIENALKLIIDENHRHEFRMEPRYYRLERKKMGKTAIQDFFLYTIFKNALLRHQHLILLRKSKRARIIEEITSSWFKKPK